MIIKQTTSSVIKVNNRHRAVLILYCTRREQACHNESLTHKEGTPERELWDSESAGWKVIADALRDNSKVIL